MMDKDTVFSFGGRLRLSLDTTVNLVDNIHRKQHLVVLEIDDKHMSSALLSDDQLSPLSHQEVDVSRVVYIGSQSTLPEYEIYPFEGCLLSLRIDGTIVHFKGGSKRNAC